MICPVCVSIAGRIFAVLAVHLYRSSRGQQPWRQRERAAESSQATPQRTVCHLEKISFLVEGVELSSS